MELKVISRETIQKTMEQDYLPHAEMFADEIAWMNDCVTLLNEVDSLVAENDKLRGLLAQGKGDCVYCGLPAADIFRCPHGFPGCARMDDIVNAPESEKDRKWQEVVEVKDKTIAILREHLRLAKGESTDGTQPEPSK